MLGDELRPGLWRWTGRYDDWRGEVLLWDPRSRALIVGDALLGDGEKGAGLHTCPASWLPESTDLDDLRASLRPTLDLPVELILTSHGAPVLSDAAAQLAGVATPSAPVASRGEWESPENHRTSP